MRADRTGTRVDLHLHSRASGTASNWWVRSLGAGTEARESYTPPETAYGMVRAAGMDFVTLTDHETIEGALALVHHPDFFVGEEVSALFPEDGAYADVLVYGIDPETHREIQARKGNVYELVDYLREAGIVHVLAHPMYGMPGPVDRDQVEKRLVLFGLWELINGSRPAEQNRLAREVVARTGLSELRQMAARHGLPAPPHRRVSGTAGSDDHGGLYGGAAHTVAPDGIASAGELLAALAAGEVRPSGMDGSVSGLVHTGFRIAGGAIEDGHGRKSLPLKSLALRFPLLRSLAPAGASEEKLLKHVPLLARMDGSRIRATLVERYEARLSDALRGVGSGFPALDLLGSLGDLVDGHLFIAPYVGVHGYFGRERNKTKALRRDLALGGREVPKVGLFVDGVEGIHGVGTMYRNLRRAAEEHHPGCFRMVECAYRDDGDAHVLRPVANLPVPLYEGLALGVPSLLDVLEHVAEEDYDVLHVATPGPLGLAALVAGIALDLPVVGAYHTEFGAYARALSGDAFVARTVDVAVRQFYEQCSVVAVPSRATELALRNRGYRIERFVILKNGVDPELFHPGRRDPGLRELLGKGKTLLLYVGRISREKDLDRLAAGYSELRRRGRDDVHLVLVGDGPYRSRLETVLGDTATFTGFLEGEALARTFASCDVFVFPSRTDTLGRAVVEAQASGLPAVVYDAGGPRECLLPDESGFVVDTEDAEDFFARVEELIDDPARRKAMSRSARAFAETLSWKAALEDLLGLHAAAAGTERTEPALVPETSEARR